MANTMRRDVTKRDELIILLATVGSLLCLNILGLEYFFRIDLTTDKAYTLAEASQKTMRDLEDPVTVTAYFSEDLPPQFEVNRRFVKDLLDEYRASSKGLLSYEFVDPLSQETDEDKEVKKEVKQDIFGRRVREQTSVEKELEALGVQSVKMTVIENDERTEKVGYMGLVIRYQEETEVIPVVQDTGSVEYDLTSMIRRLTRLKVPVLGVLQGHGEISTTEEMPRLLPLLSQNYEVRPIELADGPEARIPDDVDALLVAGTAEPYSEAQKKAIDQFILQGKSAAFLLDLMKVDLASFNPTAVTHGFGDLLAGYGIEMGGDFVADVECSTLSISERRGFMVVQMPVRYPFIPLLSVLEQESIVTRGLTDVPLAFTAPLFLKDATDGVTLTSLAKSSDKSWLEPAEAMKLDPRRDWNREDITLTGPYQLMATAQGKLRSAYAPDGASGTAPDGSVYEATGDARVLVLGTSSIARDAFLSPSTATLMLNITDWMLLDPAMLAMRNRGMADPPIDPKLDDAAKAQIKWGLEVAPLLLLALYGAIVRMRRNARRQRLMGKA